MFPEAVRMAIWGHHFFKITQEILAVDNFKIHARSIKDLYGERIRTTCASFDMDKTIQELKAAKDRFLKELRREYQAIDKDFRHMVEDSLRNVETALNAYYTQWVQCMAHC